MSNHPARRAPSGAELAEGVLAGQRAMLARAITLVESRAPHHAAQAAELVQALIPHSGGAIRVGITGAPGVGKSTLIETLGMQLVEQGRRVAVLTVDPSSSRTHGSILGDKTRMERLGRHPAAYIRPSASGGALGGVGRATRETILVCEAAGFDVVIVETVGVGQSEISVRSMVDFFLLLLLAGAGDELQAIKRGVVELADALAVTKADGENRARALAARADYLRALRTLGGAAGAWRPPVLAISALSGEGVDTIWQTVQSFVRATRANGQFEAQRREQARNWMHALVREALEQRFYRTPAVAAALGAIERAVVAQQISAAAAAEQLLSHFDASYQQQGQP
jgi:LAO/AO transport system kinase